MLKPSGRERARRVFLDLIAAFFVVLGVFGLAAWDSKAHAAGVTVDQPLNPKNTFIVLARLGPPDAQETAINSRALALPRRIPSPEFHLPGVTHAAGVPHSGPSLHNEQAARIAMEEQILWRYAGHGSDRLPWFAVEQKKRRAMMTGRPQFLMMAVIFSIMTAITLGLWRQLHSAVSGKTRRRAFRTPRRLS
ncbi:MAG: hypothetical protein ACR2O4_04235 [Hyphomicrobiaceae bacterium]